MRQIGKIIPVAIEGMDPFYQSDAWLQLRYKILKKYGRTCMLCGYSAPQVQIHVDHIKPRSTHPDLELEPDNLQVLCKACNVGKSNLDHTDWRASRLKPPTIIPCLIPVDERDLDEDTKESIKLAMAYLENKKKKDTNTHQATRSDNG
jgi:hypothetical protein